jgi:hypothetical protein
MDLVNVLQRLSLLFIEIWLKMMKKKEKKTNSTCQHWLIGRFPALE